jgi:hypothetical protein
MEVGLMSGKYKVLAVIVSIFCLIGVYTSFTTIYDNIFKDNFERETDGYFDGFRGGARSFYRMDSAEIDSDEHGKNVDYNIVAKLAEKSLLRNYPESKDWDSNYYDGFKDGYIAKYIQEYYRGY